MSETTPEYVTAASDCHPWRCRECGREMWIVTDGNAWVDGKAILPGKAGVAVKVRCPHCGAWNPWYQHN